MRLQKPLFWGDGPMRTLGIRIALLAASVCIAGGLCGCGSKEPPRSDASSSLPFLPKARSDVRPVLDIPLARRKQVFRETEKLIDRYEAKLRALNEDVAEGRLSPKARVAAMAKLREQFDADLEAIMGRYGLRTKHYPAIRAEGLEQGW